MTVQSSLYSRTPNSFFLKKRQSARATQIKQCWKRLDRNAKNSNETCGRAGHLETARYVITEADSHLRTNAVMRTSATTQLPRLQQMDSRNSDEGQPEPSVTNPELRAVGAPGWSLGPGSLISELARRLRGFEVGHDSGESLRFKAGPRCHGFARLGDMGIGTNLGRRPARSHTSSPTHDSRYAIVTTYGYRAEPAPSEAPIRQFKADPGDVRTASAASAIMTRATDP